MCTISVVVVVSKAAGVTCENIPCAEVTFRAPVVVVAIATITVFPDVVAAPKVKTRLTAVLEARVLADVD
jgi:hypothetical protein